MTRKDYIVIADTIAKIVVEAKISPQQEAIIDNEFCKVLRQENPSFDSSKFSQYIEKQIRTKYNVTK